MLCGGDGLQDAEKTSSTSVNAALALKIFFLMILPYPREDISFMQLIIPIALYRYL
jgi:hypothetical protein